MGGTEAGSEDGAWASVFGKLTASDPGQLGGYELAARLGSGGMGTVYLAYTLAGRPVAIKAIRQELADDPEFRRLFRREVAAAQRVQGLYTAPVIDSEIDGPTPWLATAFVPGPTVTAAVSRHGPLPVSAVLLLAAGVAEALQAVHGEGIVHGDLKASNVLLAADGPRVIDFGISRSAETTGRTTTGTGIAAGTPSFMSPEQAMNSRIGPATDVFSLGQLIAYAARGTSAFGGGQTFSVLYRTVHEEPDLADVPEALLPLLHRCLVKEPGERPSPAEVIDLCRAASEDGMLRRSGNWLPEAVAVEIPGPRDVPPASTDRAPSNEVAPTRRASPAMARDGLTEPVVNEERAANAEASTLTSASAPLRSAAFAGVDGKSHTPEEMSVRNRKPRGAKRKVTAAVSTVVAAVVVGAAVLMVMDKNSQDDDGGATAGTTFTDSALHLSGHSDLCIDVAGNRDVEGRPIQLWRCNADTAGQRWTMSADGKLRAYENLCMNVDGPVEEEKGIRLGKCRGGQGQKWEYTSKKELRIKEETHPRLCLDDPRGVTEDGTPLQLYRCLGGKFTQQWHVSDT